MIYLTCDLHHDTLQTGNQKFSDRNELSLALDFAKELKNRDINATFFFTGRSLHEEPEKVIPIMNFKNIEVGGHTYNAFEPQLFHRIWKKLTGNYNGPYFYEYLDVWHTKKIIKEKLGVSIKVWRNHMYMHGKNTNKILARNGIKLCSDGVKKGALNKNNVQDGVLNIPINIIPDHEHLIHAERTEDWIKSWIKRYNWSDDFGSDSYYIKDWEKLVINQIVENESLGLDSVIIIHPITMYLCDNFEAIYRILDIVKNYNSGKMSDLIGEKK